MRLTMLALGSRGDVQPLVALGAGLQNAGYQLAMATHDVFSGLVETHGLEFKSVRGNPQELLLGPEGQEWLNSQRNPLGFASGFRRLMGPVLHSAMRDGYEASRGADALIFGGPAYYIGYSIAQKLEIPYIQAYSQPVHPTRAFPSALFPTRLRLGGRYNTLSAILGGGLFWSLTRPVVNAARREYLDLPPLSVTGPYPEMMRKRSPVLYAFSPSVLPPPLDWPDFLHVTGYWFLDEPAWQPPDDLVAFLSSGPPPVYVGFGSMVNRGSGELVEIILQALRRSGMRGVLLRGWAGLESADLPESVYLLDSAPHSWLFPRMTAVVHHGGAGTTAAGLRAGRSTVIVPFFGDQGFWGDRVHELGAGPRPIDRSKLTADNLSAAVSQAVREPAMRQGALRLRECIQAEDGVGRAVALADAYLKGSVGGAL